MRNFNNKVDWENWLWHIDNAIKNEDELKKHLILNKSEQLAFQKNIEPRLFITPYILALIEANGKNSPLRKQFLPYIGKKHIEHFSNDVLHEESAYVTPHLIHKYKNRVALLVNNACANYCQFCTRQRITRYNLGKYTINNLALALEYIKNNTLINDVLVTGGDPLLLKTEDIAKLLDTLFLIKHIKIIRIGTRIPITLPMRVDNGLVSMLRKYSPLYINIHINHISEITEQSERAILALADAGIPLGSQSVLLHGINDNINTLKELFERLLQIKVRPYYLYQCDEVKGCENFIVSPLKGIKLVNDLCGLISGLAIPRYVLDTPGNFGKLTLAPCFLNETSEKTLSINNGTGGTFLYKAQTE
jgi:lysine 2,3-aminomutase